MKKRISIKQFILFGMIILSFIMAVPIMKDFSQNITVYAENDYPDAIDKAYERIPYDNFKAIVVDETAKDCKEILDGTVFTEYGLENTMISIYNAIKTIGIGLLVALFLMELLDKITKGHMDAEQLIRMLIKYVVAKMLIADNGINILKAILAIGNGIAATLSSGGTIAGADKFLSDLATYLQDAEVIEDCIITVVSVIPFFVKSIIGVVIQATCYARLIDIVIRGGFAPIGCAGIVQEGFSGHGIRYIKKFFASCIQGGIIMAMLYVMSTVSTGIANSIIDSGGFSSVGVLLTVMVKLLVIGFTQIMAVLKSGQLANDIANAT